MFHGTMNQKTTANDRELNKATIRVLQVLSSFASDVDGFGVTELSQLLGMTKNMTYRALTTLVEQRYLSRDPDSARYHLGYRILELQNPQAIEPDLRTLCAPFIRRIHLLTDESVTLCVRAMDYCVLIDGVETRLPGVWRVRIGDVLPMFALAAGRAMLAFGSDKALADYIARNRPFRHPRTGEQFSVDELKSQIVQIREQGYSRIKRASTMVSAGFPIWDLEGELHGAISVGGPAERFEGRLDALLPELHVIMDELNSRTRLFSANAAGSELN